MPSNSQQTTDASVQAQTSAALSAVPSSVWEDYEKKTQGTRAQFSKGLTLPTKEDLCIIRAKQDRDRASGNQPSLYMYEPADDCNSWKRSPLNWDFPVLEATGQKYEEWTGYPVSGTKLDPSHVGHFLNETPLPERLNETPLPTSGPGPKDQLVFGSSGVFDPNRSSKGARSSDGYRLPYPRYP